MVSGVDDTVTLRVLSMDLFMILLVSIKFSIGDMRGLLFTQCRLYCAPVLSITQSVSQSGIVGVAK